MDSTSQSDFVKHVLHCVDTQSAHHTASVSTAFAYALSAVRHKLADEKTPITTLVVLMIRKVCNNNHPAGGWPQPSVWEKVFSRAGLTPKFMEDALTLEQPFFDHDLKNPEEYRQFLAIRTYLKSQCTAE